MDEQRYVLTLDLPLYPNTHRDLTGDQTGDLTGGLTGDRTAARTNAGAVIDEQTCDRIASLCREFACSGRDLICAATIAYVAQLIDQRELVVTFLPDREILLHTGADAPAARATTHVIEHHIDAGASFASLLTRFPRSPGAARTDCDLALSAHQRLMSIAFRVHDEAPAIHVSCTSNDLEDRYASSFATGLVSFIRQLVNAPRVSCVSHRLVSEAQLDRIQRRWNDARSHDPIHCIHELFEKQVESTPHRVAVECAEVSLSYAQLNHRANQLAHRIVATLTASKIRYAPCLVGICVDRSVEMVVGILGILKAGCAYVPIDLSYPLERQSFLIKDAAITVLLTRPPFIERFSALNVTILSLEERIDSPRTENERRATPDIPVADVNLSPHRPAAVLYTSGSTGAPKGVFISHRGLASRLHWMQSRFPFSQSETAGHIAQLPFVRALWELFWASPDIPHLNEGGYPPARSIDSN